MPTKAKKPVNVGPAYLDEEPSFDDYVIARRVVLYEYNQIRQDTFNGKLSIARDEMIARIIHKSCPRFMKGDTLPLPVTL